MQSALDGCHLVLHLPRLSGASFRPPPQESPFQPCAATVHESTRPGLPATNTMVAGASRGGGNGDHSLPLRVPMPTLSPRAVQESSVPASRSQAAEAAAAAARSEAATAHFHTESIHVASTAVPARSVYRVRAAGEILNAALPLQYEPDSGAANQSRWRQRLHVHAAAARPRAGYNFLRLLRRLVHGPGAAASPSALPHTAPPLPLLKILLEHTAPPLPPLATLLRWLQPTLVLLQYRRDLVAAHASLCTAFASDCWVALGDDQPNDQQEEAMSQQAQHKTVSSLASEPATVAAADSSLPLPSYTEFVNEIYADWTAAVHNVRTVLRRPAPAVDILSQNSSVGVAAAKAPQLWPVGSSTEQVPVIALSYEALEESLACGPRAGRWVWPGMVLYWRNPETRRQRSIPSKAHLSSMTEDRLPGTTTTAADPGTRADSDGRSAGQAVKVVGNEPQMLQLYLSPGPLAPRPVDARVLLKMS